jgi:hypothetical protein
LGQAIVFIALGKDHLIMKHILRRLFVAGVLFASCGEQKQQAEAPRELQSGQLPSGHPDISAAGSSSAAGVQWMVPSKWSVGPPRQMRVATYLIPAAAGDAEGAECGVFYFGGGQGGDLQMNIDRWVGQFEKAKGPDQTSREVNGMKVVLVKIAGTYLAPSGPMMQASGKHENYRLLGAIVAAPEGSVFFKLTGPAKTVAAVEGDFQELVNSIKQ